MNIIIRPHFVAVKVIALVAFFLTMSVDADAQKKKAHAKAHHQQANKAHHHQPAAKKARRPHRHYAHLPRRGVVVKTAPAAAVVVTHKKVKFRCHDGVWYQPKGTSFVVVRAPVGIRIKLLPPKHKRVMVGTALYFYYYGTFYRQVNGSDEYEVTDAPVGAQVDALPEGYSTTTVDGEEIYELDDVYYSPRTDPNGDEVYEVVKSAEKK